MAEGKIVSNGHNTTTVLAARKSPSRSGSGGANGSASASASDRFAQISTLFFDLDNTLIPTRTADTKACRKLAEVLETQFGFAREEATTATSAFLKSFRRCPDNSQTSLDSWRTYLWRESLPGRHKHLADAIYPKWLQLRFRYLALPVESVQLLRRYRDCRYALALITNGPSNAQWEKVKKLHISQYFDCVLVSSDLPWEKPNPNIFYAACNFLKVKPANCAMIGDKLTTDIKGGCLANLGGTFWLPFNQTEADLCDAKYPPDVILRNLLDLLKYFPALNAVANGFSFNAMMMTSATSSAAATGPQCRRRGSQVGHSATTSTCDNESYYHQARRCSKSRRGGSLPEIDCMNSEAENSLDSIFS